MDKIVFVHKLVSLRQQVSETVIDNLSEPPGRNPCAQDIELSQFYKTLDDAQKEFLEKVVSESINATMFTLFCILDHVHCIKEMGNEVNFELYALTDGQKTLLNDPETIYLHDLFQDCINVNV